MELSNIAIRIDSEHQGEHSIRIEQFAERIVGVGGDVLEQRLRDEHDLQSGSGHQHPHVLLPAGAIRIQPILGRLVLVIRNGAAAVVQRATAAAAAAAAAAAVDEALDVPRRHPLNSAAGGQPHQTAHLLATPDRNQFISTFIISLFIKLATTNANVNKSPIDGAQ